MTASFFPLVGAALTAVILAVTLKSIKAEYALIVSLACGILLLLWALSLTEPIFEQLSLLLDKTGLESEYTSILAKALGVSVCAQLAADACCDAGESAIGSKIEFAGKICLLLMSLPLFSRLLEMASEILGA